MIYFYMFAFWSMSCRGSIETNYRLDIGTKSQVFAEPVEPKIFCVLQCLLIFSSKPQGAELSKDNMVLIYFSLLALLVIND